MGPYKPYTIKEDKEIINYIEEHQLHTAVGGLAMWHTMERAGKRENNSHIDCGCPREKKIPVLELEFIKAQRTKAEGQGSMQMGSIDYSETKKQIANAKKREQIREREQKKKMKSEEAIQREEELCQD
ncbi:hypothetical protein Hamer_G030245, partial [Homarus americanus]